MIAMPQLVLVFEMTRICLLTSVLRNIECTYKSDALDLSYNNFTNQVPSELGSWKEIGEYLC